MSRSLFVFKWLGWIFAAGILTQVFLAGLALFVNSADWVGHASFAKYFVFLPVPMLVISLIARLPVSLRIQNIALLGMVVLILISAMFSSKIGFLSALHPVIAVILFFRTMAIIRQANMLIQQK